MSTENPSTRPPLIGVTTYLEQVQQGVWERRSAFVPEVYLIAVTEAGGVPVLLPPQPPSDAAVARVLDALDGLVIAGGVDVDPALYGHERDPRTQDPRHDRDAWEQALLTGAIDRDLPFLAICRGAQLLNVTLGGTLHQHLPDIVETEKYAPEPGRYGLVDVDVDPDSFLDRLLGSVGDRLTVPSYHHQAVDRVADGLTVSARSDDGVVEALELHGARFGLGLQWHPEQDAADRRIFRGLVAAAS
ncbi:gamma-glutamyl-gamma-aminobutyrate hydrolase family protein [Naasia lichenicola]|uniref:Gamma-glutamyl-gamma-aminobutyrate hydrolase family protein n=1 Tax=Naasia lichenicola TaxID=2565933 RepID=A0A4S4FQZ9_9MICO|nr:gamma-glutamyl-gamma-aminobutyrate hydrolase family protein [Naasia lichenicola]THG31846.1 gamma-glutamyl-gamma-aminobutyrate hydrolase family protein [Naasia lichenicola]